MSVQRPPAANASLAASPAAPPRPNSTGAEWRIADLAWSVLATLAYADVFDFPMRTAEIRHYLIGRGADQSQIETVLESDRNLRQRIERHDGVAFLAGREGLPELRLEREQIARRLWPAARRHGAILASLPFVRMVAVTGALALENTEASGDIDFLLVTAPGRLWLARAMVVLWVRRAALEGTALCPNYLLSQEALLLPDQDLFAAHELAQMVPLSGPALYWEMRRLNHSWVSPHLPNAAGLPPVRHAGLLSDGGPRRTVGLVGERLLRLRAVDRLELWERSRKIRRFAGEMATSPRPEGAPGRTEERFGPDWCKGHFDHHASRTLATFSQRLEALAEGWQ
jgi:hypothetical protein